MRIMVRLIFSTESKIIKAVNATIILQGAKFVDIPPPTPAVTSSSSNGSAIS
jgi:hypothetical protein